MTNEQIKAIIDNAPEHATHFDGKTYFRFEMYEHGQAYLIFKNGVWDRGLPAYPVYGCHSLADLREILELREGVEKLKIEVAVQLPTYKVIREAFMDGVYWYEQSCKVSQIELDKAAHDYAESILKRSGE